MPYSRPVRKVVPQAFADTYEDVLPTIVSTASAFRRRYGGDQEELVARATEVFVDVYTDPTGTDHSRSKFTTWIRTKVSFALRGDLRTEIRRNRQLRRHPASRLDRVPAGDTEAPVLRLLADLSDDARRLVTMVLEQPVYLRAAIREVKRSPDTVPGQTKGVRRVLEDMDWSEERIDRAFAEVADALAP